MANKFFNDKSRGKKNRNNFVDGADTLRNMVNDAEVVVENAIDHVVSIPSIVESTSAGFNLGTSGGSSFAFRGQLLAPLPADLGVVRPVNIAFAIDPKPGDLPAIAWEMIKAKIKFWKDSFTKASTDVSTSAGELKTTAEDAIIDIYDLIKSPVRTIKEAVTAIVSIKLPLLPCVSEIDKELNALSSLLAILKVIMNLLKKITGIIKLIFKFPSPLVIMKFVLNICGEIANAIADKLDGESESSSGSDPNASMGSEGAAAQYAGGQTSLPPAVEGTGMYYGTGPDGTVGFFNMPAGDDDLMKKSEYDPKKKGEVTSAQWASNSRISTSGFGPKLGPSDRTVQKAIDKLSQ